MLPYIYPRIPCPAYTVPFAPVAVAIPPYYAGCYTDRRRRYEYREWRRGSDYFTYGVPAYMLWLNNDPDAEIDYGL